MVVYKVVDGTLFIYDPNIPGGTGEIKWENGRYLPYRRCIFQRLGLGYIRS